MSRTPHHRKVLWFIILGWACGSMGCIHNHYYGTSATIPGCPPTGQAITTQVGQVCDVPNNNVVVSGATTSRVISSEVTAQPASSSGGLAMPPANRVVISQPSYGPPSVGQTSNRIRSPWRRPDPENPIIKAEGAYDDSTIR